MHWFAKVDTIRYKRACARDADMPNPATAPGRRQMHILTRTTLCASLIVWAGCAAVRYADYRLPAIRFDGPSDVPLPGDDDVGVQRAIAAWQKMSPEERLQFPTPYHVYVDTPAPGSFEGAYTVGVAFSGGGTRGTVYAGACVKELQQLGPILVDTPDGTVSIDLLQETDYVSGVSTGAIPAAIFALNFSPDCPDQLRFDRWPECFNGNLRNRALRGLAARPYRIARDLTFGMNTRPALSSAIAVEFFQGRPYRLDGGLTFGDLPSTPILLIGAAVINDPGTAFIQSRLPYRFALDSYPPMPWGVGVQSFESFGADPMKYPLGEASYNSSSFPGNMRAGLMKVHKDPPWVLATLEGDAAERMARARHQPGYDGTYEIKDGGLVDNRGGTILARIFQSELFHPSRRPLLIGIDAGWLELRTAQKGGAVFRKGWFNELTAASLTSWQTGQDAYERLVELLSVHAKFSYVRFRLTAWTHYLRGASPEKAFLEELCRGEPSVGTPERLLDITRSIGTGLTDLDEEQMAALRVAARFAAWLEKEKLLEWASEAHGGIPARFAGKAE